MAVFFITGTSSGFGAQIAKQALQAGHRVIAASRDAGKLSELKDLGAHTLSLDINAPDSDIQKTIKEAASIYGTIDILVNNAGYIWEGALEEAS
jgi:NADP-dependent 3-hydroxy acid dehydrogenase YdfG